MRVSAAHVKARVSIPSLLGLPFAPNHKVPCPFCSPTVAKDRRSLWVSETGFRCYRCGRKGDVFRFVMELYGCDFKEALQRLSGGDLKLPDRSLEITLAAAAISEAGTVMEDKNVTLDAIYEQWEYGLLWSEGGVDKVDCYLRAALINSTMNRMADSVEIQANGRCFDITHRS